MKTIRKFGFLAGLCLVFASMLVGPAASAAGWSGYVTITQVQITNGDVYVQISNNAWPTMDGCTSYGWGIIPEGSGNLNLLTSTIYDASVNGDGVKFYVNGCHYISQTVSYPIITMFKGP